MIKNLHLNFISTFLIGVIITSCGGKKENFDIDLSDIKLPNKNSVKISKSNESESLKTKKEEIKNELITYKKSSEVLNSIKIGKKDPFSQQSEINNLSSVIKITGYLDSGIEKYVFVNYQNNNGTITEGSVGGVSTNLLPNGAKVIAIDTQNMNLKINFENIDYIFRL